MQLGSAVAIRPGWRFNVTVGENEVGFVRHDSPVLGNVERVGDGWLVLRIGATTLARVLTEGVTTETAGLVAGGRFTVQGVSPRWVAQGFINNVQKLSREFTDRAAAVDTINTWTVEHSPGAFGWVRDELTGEIEW